MKPCIVIPCYDHPTTVAAVAKSAQAFCPLLIVDDGSTQVLPEMPGCTLIRLGKNSGKGAALLTGFKHAAELGFTHAITMDAAGQHFADDLPKFLATAQSQPDALIVGVRDFYAAGCPNHRRRSNAVSTFWFRVETGVRLGDTQCGFRCYPIKLAQNLRLRSSRYALELEFMVRASWVGTPIVPVPVQCSYEPHQIRLSHFRPVKDLAHITFMNIGLVLQSWFVPRTLRVLWSYGKKVAPLTTLREFFSDHAHDPLHVSLAVGLGLFFGIVPIWGFQMAAAAAVAHFLRLNKAITLVASNISIPPVAPVIAGLGFILGHWMFTGELLALSWPQITRATFSLIFVQFLVGSFALALIVAALGATSTYVLARLFRRK
jgi:uncharacterized protein (DUF2062 family)